MLALSLWSPWIPWSVTQTDFCFAIVDPCNLFYWQISSGGRDCGCDSPCIFPIKLAAAPTGQRLMVWCARASHIMRWHTGKRAKRERRVKTQSAECKKPFWDLPCLGRGIYFYLEPCAYVVKLCDKNAQRLFCGTARLNCAFLIAYVQRPTSSMSSVWVSRHTRGEMKLKSASGYREHDRQVDCATLLEFLQ